MCLWEKSSPMAAPSGTFFGVLRWGRFRPIADLEPGFQMLQAQLPFRISLRSET